MYKYLFFIFFLSGCVSFVDDRNQVLKNHGWQLIRSNKIPIQIIEEKLCGDVGENVLWFVNENNDYLSCDKYPFNEPLCNRGGTSCYNLNEFGYQCFVSFPYGIKFNNISWNKSREKLIAEEKAEQLKTEEQKKQEELLFPTLKGCK